VFLSNRLRGSERTGSPRPTRGEEKKIRKIRKIKRSEEGFFKTPFLIF